MLGEAGSPLSVVVPLPPSYRGGTEEYAYRLAEWYARTVPVHIFTTTVRWDADAPQIEFGAAELERLPAREVLERPLLLSVPSRRRLFRDVRGSSGMQLHMPFPFVEAPAVRAARAEGIPTVLTYHMDADLGGARRVPGAAAVTAAYRALSAFPALDACDVVVSNSRGYAEASPVLSRFLRKVRVIHKGVDPARLGLRGPRRRERYLPAGLAPDDVPPGRSRLVFLGRLVPYKGVPVLLEATRRLLDRGEDVILLIGGRGPQEPELRALAAQLGIEARVRFLGFVPDRDVGALYRFADAVVVPSVSTLESSATALEEAAMCGTPVVGTDLPGAGETVPHDGRRGVLVPPGDPDALAAGIGKVLDAGRPAQPTPLRTWDAAAEEYAALFDELGAAHLGSRRPGRLGRLLDRPRAPSLDRPLGSSWLSTVLRGTGSSRYRRSRTQ